jgi:hypothetical protein
MYHGACMVRMRHGENFFLVIHLILDEMVHGGIGGHMLLCS